MKIENIKKELRALWVFIKRVVNYTRFWWKQRDHVVGTPEDLEKALYRPPIAENSVAALTQEIRYLEIQLRNTLEALESEKRLASNLLLEVKELRKTTIPPEIPPDSQKS